MHIRLELTKHLNLGGDVRELRSWMKTALVVSLLTFFMLSAQAASPGCTEDLFGNGQDEGSELDANDVGPQDEFEDRLKEANIYLALYTDISEVAEIAEGLNSLGVTSDHLLALELRLPGKFRDRSRTKKEATVSKRSLSRKEKFFAHSLDQEVYSQLPFELRGALRDELDRLPAKIKVAEKVEAPLPPSSPMTPELVPAEDLDPLFESFTFLDPVSLVAPETEWQESKGALLDPRKMLKALIQTYGRKDIEAFDAKRPKLRMAREAKAKYPFTPEIRQLMSRIEMARSGDQVRDAVVFFRIIGRDLLSTVSYAELEPEKQAVVSETVWNFFLHRIPNSKPRFVEDSRMVQQAYDAFNEGWATRSANISAPSERLTRDGQVRYLFRYNDREFVFSICAVERQCGHVGQVQEIYPKCGPGIWSFDPEAFGRSSYFLTKSYLEWQTAVRDKQVRGKDSSPRKVISSLSDLGFRQILCREAY